MPLQAEKMILKKNLSFLLTFVQKDKILKEKNLQRRPDGPCLQCQYKGLDVRLADKKRTLQFATVNKTSIIRKQSQREQAYTTGNRKFLSFFLSYQSLTSRNMA